MWQSESVTSHVFINSADITAGIFFCKQALYIFVHSHAAALQDTHKPALMFKINGIPL